MQSSDSSKRLRRLVIVGILCILALFGAYTIYNVSVFRIVKTDPGLSAVSEHSPFIKVYFSKVINPSTVKVSDYGGILRRTYTNDKTLTLEFGRPLQVDKEYTLIIEQVRSTAGDTIVAKKLVFTPKDIPVTELSKDQQAKILADQDKYIPYSTASTTYVGFDELTDQGISSGQLESIKTALFDYSKSINKEFRKIVLSKNTVNVVFRDPSTREEDGNSVTFTVTTLGKSYQVRTEYVGLEETTYTRIYADGVVVFDNTLN